MFCTTCAAVNPGAAAVCVRCGAGFATAVPTPSAYRHRSSTPFGRVATPAQVARRSSRPRVLQALYLVPVLLLLAIGAFAVKRYQTGQVALAAAYEAATRDAVLGDHAEAVAGFTEASGYRDADTRRAAALATLAPYRLAYLSGISALEAGDYPEAIATLVPVARDLPGFEDVTVRLADARRFQADDLRRQADVAERERDWLGVEEALTALAIVDPGDATVGARLATVQRNHAPFVFARDRALLLASPDGSDERLLTDDVPAIWPTWSPDRSRIAFISVDPVATSGSGASLYTIQADGSGLTRLAENLSAHTAPVWSPDGSRLAFTSFATYDLQREQGQISIRMVTLADGQERDLTGATFPLAINPAWSPAGDRVAFISKNRLRGSAVSNMPGSVIVLDLATGETIDLTEERLPNAWSVAWSPADDRLLVFTLYGQTWYEPPQTSLRLVDARTGTSEPIETTTPQPVAPIWSPDGTRFAFADGELLLQIYEEGVPAQSVTASSSLSGEITWSPDGNALIAAAMDPSEPSTMVSIADGSATVTPLHLAFDFDGPFFGPPQWGPVHPAPPPAPPTVAGTGLDPR